MTNIEALKAKVGYPLSENAFKVALNTRGLVSSEIFDSTLNTRSFELSYADCLITLLTTPGNVSEGGFSISAPDRQSLSDIANRIYAKYKELSPISATKQTAKFVQRW